MAHTYEELKKKTVEDLREIAKGLGEDAVKGYTQMNKEPPAPHPVQGPRDRIPQAPAPRGGGIDKAKLKARMHQLRADKQKALEAGDAAKLKAIRREYHHLNRKIRAATGLDPSRPRPARGREGSIWSVSEPSVR